MKSMWKKLGQLKQKNKGFSLVEVLIAVAILAIISSSTLLFMRQSSLTYNKTSTDIEVQTDAQLTANAITDRVIDCETQLKFYDGHESTTVDPSGATVTVTDSYEVRYKVEGTSYLVKDHVLQLTNADSETQAVIFWDKDREVIYYNETEWNGSDWAAFEEEKAELIASDVTLFDVHTEKLEKQKILEFDIEYSNQGRKYKGSYQVHMRNDVVEGSGATPGGPEEDSISRVTVEPSTAYIIAKKNQPLTLPGIFNARVSGKGALSKVTWDVTATPEQSGVEPNTSIVTQSRFAFQQKGVTPIPDPTVKSFKLVAYSIQDPSKSGYATIYVKKATGVNIETTSELRNNDEGKPAATKNSTINFTGSTDGWNLTRAETGVTWKLYKSIKNSRGTYSAWTEANNTSEAYMSGTTVVLKGSINESYRFKVEAISTFDTAIKNEYIFYVLDNAVDVDVDFLRGVNMDLKSYFTANPMEIAGDVINVTNIDRIEITSVPDYPGDYSEFIYFDSNGVLYVDYDAYDDGDFARKRRFYKELTIGLNVYFTNADGSDMRATSITLPAVQVIRVNPTVENIVVRKGNTTDIQVQTPGYNLTSASLMGIYIDGEKVSGSGSSELNKYLSCRMVTNEDGSNILGTRDNGVINGKFKLTASSTERKYPTKSIPLKIAVDDYYVVSGGDALSYVQYNVYVANVEGNTQYIPGPGQYGFPSGVDGFYSSKTVTIPVSNVSTSDSISVSMKKTGGRYYMKYNATEYIYDTAYNYWKKTR